MTRNVALTNKPPRGAASKIRRWAAEGRTKNAIAKNLGTSLKTLNAWMERYPTLQQAWDDGLEDEHQIIHAGFMKAIKDGNVTAMIFMAKCRHKYRENAGDEADSRKDAVNNAVTFLLERIPEDGIPETAPEQKEYVELPSAVSAGGKVIQFVRDTSPDDEGPKAA